MLFWMGLTLGIFLGVMAGVLLLALSQSAALGDRQLARVVQETRDPQPVYPDRESADHLDRWAS